MPSASASFCLDAFALLAWLQDEPGAAIVDRRLGEAEAGAIECWTSIINIGEVFYRLARLRDREEAEAFWKDAVRRRFPFRVVEATRRRVHAAAQWKARFAIAYADAFALQTAVEFDATLLTGDPELEALDGVEGLRFEWLPRRKAASRDK
jgi:predicted nucleic acid-binding protein